MSTAPQRGTKLASEVRNVAVSFVGKLDVGENLTGLPTVVEVGSADLTISNVAVSLVELTINDVKVAAGRAVQCRVSGGVAGTRYVLRVTATSNATPAQTLIANLILNVAGD